MKVQLPPFNSPFEMPVEKPVPESKAIVFIVDDDFSVAALDSSAQRGHRAQCGLAVGAG